MPIAADQTLRDSPCHEHDLRGPRVGRRLARRLGWTEPGPAGRRPRPAPGPRARGLGAGVPGRLWRPGRQRTAASRRRSAG